MRADRRTNRGGLSLSGLRHVKDIAVPGPWSWE